MQSVPFYQTKCRLWVEFLLFFIAVPLGMAVFLPATFMFPVLLGFTLIGCILLHLTPEFYWRDLWQCLRLDMRAVVLVACVTAAISLLVMSVFHPEALFMIVRERPMLWVMIMLLYPIVSALPQEIVFRPLFFKRYAAILPSSGASIVLNAAVFSVAHLLYWSWIVAVMTFAGGLVFAWAYKVRRSFALAVVLHAVAGNILFTMGMGVYFYSGAVVRPF